ncbi:peptidase [Nitratireductor aquimarinus]|uniref:imelysin family protein n=1 Tax=Nitratireductor TaxID=245876 RepID=UPI0019D34994|nr:MULTISPECIES: imelysin family protein [Nitratireductor]MBN7777233.1 peptidase [Nitratireductor pacificus]MBN7780904.1 peptidase [Nitratireductor pacificus]MBN7789710.1 peptidase [Nitratireductor aquimarinus]MBY6099442.1 peptidase [Nitratireductor aquimarinus]MCA1262593.1 peptidase [Nitratireductor aquimarinus]
MKRRLLLGSAIMAVMAAPAIAAEPQEVVETYADIALATYQDSLETAKELRTAINALVETPSEETMAAAREAWLASRVPYQQTEAFRFGNAIVDEWEGKVNAWPLDEGLIDYVDASYGTESDANEFYTVNVIANDKVSAGGTDIDVTEITTEVIASLHEVGGIEANVATGYHAIEFLLWGQDLNGTDAGAGTRAYTDFDTENCTGGNCERRAQYLQAAADLLITDLEEMVANWETEGEARAEVMADPQAGLTAMLTGLGSLSYGELAGERMKLGLLLNDPEEEHDCFSDNTHNSHYYDVVGIRNVYFGAYERVDGSMVEGPGLADLVSEKDAALADEVKAKLDTTLEAMAVMKARADGGEAYDQMIGQGNEEGNAVVQAAIDGLVDQTRSLERVIVALDLSGIELEGSDSLDNPEAVFE